MAPATATNAPATGVETGVAGVSARPSPDEEATACHNTAHGGDSPEDIRSPGFGVVEEVVAGVGEAVAVRRVTDDVEGVLLGKAIG